jgi:hypothetical protein
MEGEVGLSGPEAVWYSPSRQATARKDAGRAGSDGGRGRMSSVVKKRRKKIRKHKLKKLRKRMRHKK